MYTVYILNNGRNKNYIGCTENLAKRISKHNHGGSRYTRNKGPWKIIYQEAYSSKAEALKRERQIKSYKGGGAFKKLVNT